MNKNAILCVDDEEIIIRTLRSLLTNSFDNIQIIEIAKSAEEALEVLDEFQKDNIDLKVVIADYIMPTMRGDKLLIEIHKRLPRTKKIMLTGQNNISGIKRAINEANLYRFIEKPWDNEDLILTINGAILAYDNELKLEQQYKKLIRLNEELELKVATRTKELELLTVTDQLTRIGNRLKLDQEFEKEIERTKRYAAVFSIILLDIDNFKSVNDLFGHQVGDQTLIAIADIIKTSCRKTDILGRWGGEEFLIICPQTDLQGATSLAKNIHAKIKTHHFLNVGKKTASFGITCFKDEDNVHTMLKRADTALYMAKDKGRDRIEII